MYGKIEISWIKLCNLNYAFDFIVLDDSQRE